MDWSLAGPNILDTVSSILIQSRPYSIIFKITMMSVYTRAPRVFYISGAELALSTVELFFFAEVRRRWAERETED